MAAGIKKKKKEDRYYLQNNINEHIFYGALSLLLFHKMTVKCRNWICRQREIQGQRRLEKKAPIRIEQVADLVFVLLL